MDPFGVKLTSPNFECKLCDFKCCKQSDWNRHIKTQKHSAIEIAKTPHDKTHFCLCGKGFVTNSGLWRHKQKCSNIAITPSITSASDMVINYNQIALTPDVLKSLITPELCVALFQQNKELQTMLVDQSKEIQNILVNQNTKLLDMVNNGTNNGSIANNNNVHSNNHNNSNNHNKTFNLQFFLNETCKNAMNMSQFIEQMQISLEDLEETGRIGYVEGISKLFIKNLKNLEITDRPIHCSDAKRETLYIKNEDVWTKNDDINRLLTNAIKEVAKKNSLQIGDWQKKYPGYKDPDSRDSDKYQKMILNSMPGSTKDECSTNYNKIIKNIAKEVIIQK